MVWAYNNKVHWATGYMAFLMCRCYGRLPVDLLLGSLEILIHRMPSTAKTWVQEHSNRIQKAKQVLLDRHKDLGEGSAEVATGRLSVYKEYQKRKRQ